MFLTASLNVIELRFQWFAEHVGEEVSWPKPLDDGTRLADQRRAWAGL